MARRGKRRRLIEPVVFWTSSAEETEEVGKKIGILVEKGDLLCLTGDLGAGKTTLIKGIVKQRANVDPSQVTSPTFSYMHVYEGAEVIYHFDLYRLSSPQEFLEAGFMEFLSTGSICCIEWPDKLPSNLSLQKVLIHLEYLSQEKRKITVQRENG